MIPRASKLIDQNNNKRKAILLLDYEGINYDKHKCKRGEKLEHAQQLSLRGGRRQLVAEYIHIHTKESL